MAILGWLVNISTVVLGLGFVIFIHELGHFLMAKWAGVKVEAFALGFFHPIVSYRKGLGVRFGSSMGEYRKRIEAADDAGQDPETLGLGETEYSIRVLPLGGFVKMLGEGEELESDAAKTSDPRAYPNKPVGARMAIISAGVLMNLVSGIIFFVWAFAQGGLPITPARIGAVFAGHPAYSAGLQDGDEIVTVNGRHDLDYMSLKRITALSGPGQVLHLELKRPGVKDVIRVDVEPRRMGSAEMKTMGILPSSEVVFGPKPILPTAGLANPGPLADTFKEDDRIVAVGPEGKEPIPITDNLELREVLSRDQNQPVIITAKREEVPGHGAKQIEATLPVVPFVDFGFVLTTGPIVAMRPDSPAGQAGLHLGDRIVGIEGVELLDPMRLPDEIARRAGQPVVVKVARSEAGKPEEIVTRTVTPSPSYPWIEPILDGPLDVPGLGLAIEVVPRIASIRPDTPAARVDLRPGDVLASLTLTSPRGDDGKPAQSEILKLGAPNLTYPPVFYRLQFEPPQSVQIKLANRDATVAITPVPDPSWTNPLHGFRFGSFLALQRPLPSLSLGDAVRRGLDESYDTVLSIYAMFRSLIFGDISPKALGGPLTIADIASKTARAGLVHFIQFLGVISLNLAVINFLPIPPLDGGQMVFLLAEKVRSRPLPERALGAVMIAGFVLVFGLMIYVLGQDILKYVFRVT